MQRMNCCESMVAASASWAERLSFISLWLQRKILIRRPFYSAAPARPDMQLFAARRAEEAVYGQSGAGATPEFLRRAPAHSDPAPQWRLPTRRPPSLSCCCSRPPSPTSLRLRSRPADKEMRLASSLSIGLNHPRTHSRA